MKNINIELFNKYICFKIYEIHGSLIDPTEGYSKNLFIKLGKFKYYFKKKY